MVKRVAILVVIGLLLVGSLALYLGMQRRSGSRGLGAHYLQDLDPVKMSWHYWSTLIMEGDGADEELVKTGLENSDLLLAYINIGYAEEWRDYWVDIGDEPWVHMETEYEGEFFVKYWRSQWYEIMRGEVQRYLSKGFEGVYLDNIDASEAIGDFGFQMGRDRCVSGDG